MAVADTYSAMTTDRPYRKALTRAEAISELHTCSGTQFDPQIVETFIACIERGEEGVTAPPSGSSAAAFVLPVETETETDAETEAEETRERGPASGAFPRSESSAPASAIDQEEMRDRIATTCARLKAKAFDAMVRGETALLSHDDGPDTGLAPQCASSSGNVGSMVDEAFSEEEA